MSPARIHHALRAYLSTRVWTATEAERLDELLRLLEAHLTELDAALDGDTRWEEGQRCLAILGTLRSGLREQVHPELTARLQVLYGFIGARVVEGMLDREAQAVEAARRVALELRTAWGVKPIPALGEPAGEAPPS